MQDNRGRFVASLAFVVLVFAAAQVLFAQAVPLLDPAYAGSVTVSGHVNPSGGPVIIYDISYPTQTKLGGSGSIDRRGNFAVTVKPALILGHRIVAVQGKGSTGPAMLVTAPPLSPTGHGR
jgi:hypothetical protein